MVRPVIDFALERPEIDPDRIILVGWSFGGSLAPRAAAFEHRIAALVADPGQWDQRDAVIPALPLSDEEKQCFPDIDPERLSPMEEWLQGPEADPMLRWRLLQRGLWVNGVDNLFDYLVSMLDYELSPVVSRVLCPTLLTAAEGDPIAAGASKLLEAIEVPKRLVRFTAAEGAGGHCEGAARALYHQRVFDWLDETPFAGSDGQTHLVYGLETTNFSSGEITIEQLEVLDADTGDVVDTLDAQEVAGCLQPAGLRDAADTFAPLMMATIFLHVIFDEAGEVPDGLVHRLSVQAEAAPPDQQQLTEEVGPTEVDRRNVVGLGPPLRGSNYLAADSCCDSTLHRHAALPINGRIRLVQRYAVDYEQLDSDNRIYSGEKEVDNYTIYGQEALAVADGTVVKVTDGVPEQEPGVFPEGISPDEADGNSVILDIGGGNYALYAHFQPGSVRVQEGDRVERGDVLALVGSSGNSLAPTRSTKPSKRARVLRSPRSIRPRGSPEPCPSINSW